MKAIILAIVIPYALLLSILATVFVYADEIDCWLNPGTDTCVGCVDDCLDPMDPQPVELITEYVVPEPIWTITTKGE